MNVAKGSKSWIFTPIIIGMFFFILSFFTKNPFFNITLFLTFFFIFISCFFLIFFRDPKREIGHGIVACADGKIREIVATNDNEIGECIKISTFMNIYNVHVNRMPIDGKIKNIDYKPGSHIPAFKKESNKNERIIITIDTNIGLIKIIQIAGTIARRIVPYIKIGYKLRKGDKIGLIRLGSRVDIILPSKKIKKISINLKSLVKAGEDTIAEINY